MVEGGSKAVGSVITAGISDHVPDEIGIPASLSLSTLLPIPSSVHTPRSGNARPVHTGPPRLTRHAFTPTTAPKVSIHHPVHLLPPRRSLPFPPVFSSQGPRIILSKHLHELSNAQPENTENSPSKKHAENPTFNTTKKRTETNALKINKISAHEDGIITITACQNQLPLHPRRVLRHRVTTTDRPEETAGQGADPEGTVAEGVQGARPLRLDHPPILPSSLPVVAQLPLLQREAQAASEPTATTTTGTAISPRRRPRTPSLQP